MSENFDQVEGQEPSVQSQESEPVSEENGQPEAKKENEGYVSLKDFMSLQEKLEGIESLLREKKAEPKAKPKAESGDYITRSEFEKLSYLATVRPDLVPELDKALPKWRDQSLDVIKGLVSFARGKASTIGPEGGAKGGVKPLKVQDFIRQTLLEANAMDKAKGAK